MSGSHSSSDDSSDSRKRPPDQVLYPDSSPKRANCDEPVHLKVLIPSIAAGAVIGKAGEAIGKIQKDTNTKVKISKQDEFYPGTTERICLIMGSLDDVMCVHNYIMDRIMEKPDPNPHATCEGRLNVERHKQVKILVPNSTAGMVIGKGGAFIQEIKEKTGAYVQVSQKSREYNLLERCIIIAGDLDQTRAAVQLILAVIAADPQSASCPNLSYDDVRGPVASVYPTGSPYAIPIVPYATAPGWLTNSSVDPTATNTAAMMAAVLTSHSLGASPAVRNTSFGFFSGKGPSASDLSPLTSFASSNPSLNLGPLIPSAALPGLGGNGLFDATSTTFASGATQPGFATALVDPGSTMAAITAAQQAALLASSFRCKPQLFRDIPQLSQPALSPSAFISPSPLMPGYQSSAIANPGAYPGVPCQQSFSDVRASHMFTEPRSSPGALVSGSSSTSPSPSIAASVALAALSATAGAGTLGSPSTHATIISSPGAFLGMVQSPPVASGALPVSQLSTQLARPDPLSMAATNMSPVSPSWFLTLSEAAQSLQTLASGVASPPTSPPTATTASPLSVFGLYAVQSTAGTSSLSAGPTMSIGNYAWCKRVLAVPENVIGFILGPQGRSIVDLQSVSGTVIQISQKGVYAPGTQNRMIAITGPQFNVQWVSTLIEQRVATEQLRRESLTSECTAPSMLPLQIQQQTHSEQNVHAKPIDFFYSTTIPVSLCSDLQFPPSTSGPTTIDCVRPKVDHSVCVKPDSEKPGGNR